MQRPRQVGRRMVMCRGRICREWQVDRCRDRGDREADEEAGEAGRRRGLGGRQRQVDAEKVSRQREARGCTDTEVE